MEINDTVAFVFQADSPIVERTYRKNSNYIIEYDDSVSREYCAVYFSSNDLYFPNSTAAFEESVIRKNRFEWYNTRIKYAFKHIFLRDIKKQWYIEGINSEINSPEKLATFLKRETEGFKSILIGSSAGGFISVIMGQLLGADRIFSFNGQFEIDSLLEKDSAAIMDPLLARNQCNNELRKYYDSKKFITNPSSIFYFHSCRNSWDIRQASHVKDLDINKISFLTSNHGIPFLKSNLKVVLNLELEELKRMKGKVFHPVFFSIRLVGLRGTLQGVGSIIRFAINKIYIRTIQRWKSK